jgi:alkaline phosphatase D
MNLTTGNRRLMMIYVGMWLAWSPVLYAQKRLDPGLPSRIQFTGSGHPYRHGVASGDPLSDRVIIWTRLHPDAELPATTPEARAALVLTADWEVAHDTAFTRIVQRGTARTTAEVDFTLKVDVAGLAPDTWYYYRFRDTQGRVSPIGRTRTLPTGDAPHFRLAVVSCARIENGWFNAYGSLARSNSVDAVLMLGDYYYEYLNVQAYPSGEYRRRSLTQLGDYRARHHHYRLDPDLQECHRQYPFILIWDDHEVVNNSYATGAQNHYPDQGSYRARQAAALQAYFEWLPIREPENRPRQEAYRKLELGSLADLLVLETRFTGRDSIWHRKSDYSRDTGRTVLGATQRQWLFRHLTQSRARWRILGQQIMVAPLYKFHKPLNPDQWDGYPREREALLRHIADLPQGNTVFLTGDIHTAWGNDVPIHRSDYRRRKGRGSVAVEFVSQSITSRNAPYLMPNWFFTSSNRHVRYLNLWQHGWLTVDLTPEQVQADWYFVRRINRPTHRFKWRASRRVVSGTRHLVRARKPTRAGTLPALAPPPARTPETHLRGGWLAHPVVSPAQGLPGYSLVGVAVPAGGTTFQVGNQPPLTLTGGGFHWLELPASQPDATPQTLRLNPAKTK